MRDTKTRTLGVSPSLRAEIEAVTMGGRDPVLPSVLRDLYADYVPPIEHGETAAVLRLRRLGRLARACIRRHGGRATLSQLEEAVGEVRTGAILCDLWRFGDYIRPVDGERVIVRPRNTGARTATIYDWTLGEREA